MNPDSGDPPIKTNVAKIHGGMQHSLKHEYEEGKTLEASSSTCKEGDTVVKSSQGKV
ncbi:MAG: hypothetical protein F7C08_01470 [Desulfurococcales archaeon]|nr:hypothetical protein [Desulfurococcales archaeon]